MRNMYKLYEVEVPRSKLPDSIDLDAVVSRYALHAHHLVAWPKTPPQPTELPRVDEASHVVQKVRLNSQGGLDISFIFISTLRGSELSRVFDTSKFTMVPIISDDGTMVVRFDFIQED